MLTRFRTCSPMRRSDSDGQFLVRQDYLFDSTDRDREKKCGQKPPGHLGHRMDEKGDDFEDLRISMTPTNMVDGGHVTISERTLS